MGYLSKLPPDIPVEELETRAVWKKIAQCSAELGKLKGVLESIPDPRVLVGPFSLLEASHSSAVENIVTTLDDVYKGDPCKGSFPSPAAKAVHNCAEALRYGVEKVKAGEGITPELILDIQKKVGDHNAGFRTMPGVPRNDLTGETLFSPPHNPEVIQRLMENLDAFINGRPDLQTDPLIKMALIHYQFLRIHPFYEGNGRTGRILVHLYLVREGWLELPILSISQYITRNREKYYTLLQEVQERDAWEAWILYMLEAVEWTAKDTVEKIRAVRTSMMRIKHRIRTETPKIYSPALINNLFRHPYTRIAFLRHDLDVHWLTARKYLEVLVGMGILRKLRLGRVNYYVNTAFFEVLEGNVEE